MNLRKLILSTWSPLTWNVKTARAMRALSFTPPRLIAVKTTKTRTKPTKVEKGRDTSPARYSMAVAADTTEVAEKSNKRSTAPTSAIFFDDTLSLYS